MAPRFDRPEAFCWLAIQTCLGRDFVVVLRKGTSRASCNSYYAVVLLVGSSEEAKRFVYRLHLYGADHRLSWEAKTPGLFSHAETFRCRDGLVFGQETAERLCDGDDLNIDVAISFAPARGGCGDQASQ
ncbi:hypothetical protein HPB50_025876 [Hyalomma asiaticum]|uniref:Uncharacterized protein n=1 Tax=Hyalomma asiaticum TaxID=266040 RepID=A0ACB7TC43_HYAAI|nr:hypothetical protein HPB50_025876 [Hyalomma asiaticum]